VLLELSFPVKPKRVIRAYCILFPEILWEIKLIERKISIVLDSSPSCPIRFAVRSALPRQGRTYVCASWGLVDLVDG
jgi:hypothetical protein